MNSREKETLSKIEKLKKRKKISIFKNFKVDTIDNDVFYVPVVMKRSIGYRSYSVTEEDKVRVLSSLLDEEFSETYKDDMDMFNFVKDGNNEQYGYHSNYRTYEAILCVPKNKELTKALYQKNHNPFVINLLTVNTNQHVDSVVNEIMSKKLSVNTSKLDSANHFSFRELITSCNLSLNTKGLPYINIAVEDTTILEKITKIITWITIINEMGNLEDEEVSIVEALEDENFAKKIKDLSNMAKIEQNSLTEAALALAFSNFSIENLNTVKKREIFGKLTKADLKKIDQKIGKPSTELIFDNSLRPSTVNAESVISQMFDSIRNKEIDRITIKNVWEYVSLAEMRNKREIYGKILDSNMQADVVLLNRSFLMESAVFSRNTEKKNIALSRVLDTLGSEYIKNKIKLSQIYTLQNVFSLRSIFPTTNVGLRESRNIATDDLEKVIISSINKCKEKGLGVEIFLELIVEFCLNYKYVENIAELLQDEDFLERFKEKRNLELLLNIEGVEVKNRNNEEQPRNNHFFSVSEYISDVIIVEFYRELGF